MSKAIATLSNLRQSPRKVRVVADLVRGKKVADAIVSMQFTEKRASQPIRKLIESAVANAKAQSMSTENLIVKTIEVNEGKTLYRSMPTARGSAHPIRKRTSQITLSLEEGIIKAKKERFTGEKTIKKVEVKKAVLTKKTEKVVEAVEVPVEAEVEVSNTNE
ncbi:MAG: 50S ribosomal protein L22 [Candidatus Zambryskibacteria bacterium]|nr:50S ribosomal protein L22 [Candidatus Zambryskibacteria bacterium]